MDTNVKLDLKDQTTTAYLLPKYVLANEKLCKVFCRECAGLANTSPAALDGRAT